MSQQSPDLFEVTTPDSKASIAKEEKLPHQTPVAVTSAELSFRVAASACASHKSTENLEIFPPVNNTNLSDELGSFNL